jgi:EAL domain-containing protein (putative c-di-GMP-specific phosphodiesterase class I)
MVAQIGDQVQAAGLTLQDVAIEITEQVLLERVSTRIIDQLTNLRDRGARLVLDDFGTGNAGLAQLLRLNLDAVKLDRRFIHGLGDNERADAIVRATLSLAHGLGLEVIAEGVETVQQSAILRRLGCDAAQGYLFARPMDSGALRGWVEAA